MTGVRLATEGDAEAIVRTLVRAFDRDPFVCWLVRDDAARPRRMHRYMDTALRRVTLPHAQVWVSEGCDAAALWAPPGAWEMSLGQQLRLLPAVIEVVGARRLGTVAQGLAEVERRRPPQPWWFLALLGTDPDAQGRGLASRTLAPVLERCDRDGAVALLDTCSPDNLGFYERKGFRVMAEVDLPAGGPRCYTMRRDPHGRVAPRMPIT